MFVKQLALTNFRNYEAASVDFQPGVNLIIGPNGQGKTNLVEAIRYLSTLNSHRVTGYQALIRKDQPSALVRSLIAHGDREVLIELELNRTEQNRARVNRASSARVRDILGYLNSVTFAPEDLDIVKRDPSNRRDFIDELIVQFWPRFAGIYSDFERALKQRNNLLKSARATGTRGSALSTLDAWDESLVNYGAEIIAARVDLVNRIRPELLLAYQAIAGAGQDTQIFVKSSILQDTADDPDEPMPEEYLELTDRAAISTVFMDRLRQIRPKELERGITLIGPQRDDLALFLGDLPVKGFASHGESWSYALALRLASANLLRAESRLGDPIIILDDVFAELDTGRRNRLSELIQPSEQVLITAAVADDVPSELSARKFHVKQGVITGE